MRVNVMQGGWWVLAGLLIAGCDREPAPAPELHDTKYLAIGANGEPAGEAEEAFPCVLDQYTGLTWEVKSDRAGLHDWRNTYSWFNPREASDGELDYRGSAHGGTCAGSGCDTEAFAAAVNAAGLCGFDDWRVPTRDELASISDPRKAAAPPTINTAYFPHAQADEYWSSNDYSFQWNAAWLWNFQHGHDRVEWKASPRHVRLVRGEPRALQRVKD